MDTAHVVKLVKHLGDRLSEGHPWVYRDALEPFEAAAGEVVDILDKKGRFIGRGIADDGPIAVRVFATRDEAIDAGLFQRRLHQALALRADVLPPETTAYRLLNGEGDRTPGVTMDRYEAEGSCTAVLRLDGEGASAIVDVLVQAMWPVLVDEGVTGLLVRHGRRGERPTLVRGEAPPERIVVREHGMALVANLFEGQKTGLFLDHRESRRRVRELARGRRVLNLYAYTGGFSVAAGLGGANAVTSVDVAPAAIALSEETWSANGLGEGHTGVARDVRDFLEDDRGMYDLIIADPPSFAPSEKALEAAERAYDQMHASCLKRLVPGGIYVAASCSSHLRGDRFDATLRRGARKAGRVLQMLERTGAPADHPRLAAFPEGEYLDVVVCRPVG